MYLFWMILYTCKKSREIHADIHTYLLTQKRVLREETERKIADIEDQKTLLEERARSNENKLLTYIHKYIHTHTHRNAYYARRWSARSQK